MTETDRYRVTARDLQADIKEILLDRGLQPGDPVPTEAVLIEVLGVSRGSLREALKSLQAVGIIETRHGSGSVVGQPSFAAMADGLAFHSRLGEVSDSLSTAADLVDIREILETVLIRRVALAADDRLADDLGATVDRMAESVRGGDHSREFDQLDLEFHTRLYSELGNVLVLRLLEAFWGALRGVRGSLPDPFDEPADAVRKHRAIADAVRAGDADAAEAAMRAHFATTRAWIVSGGSRAG